MISSLTVCFLCALSRVHGLGQVILDGDVFIEFIGAIYLTPDTIDNTKCTNLETETVQNIQAIKWTLEQVNKDANNYQPGFKVGLRVSQTCKKEGEDRKLALKLAMELQDPGGTDIVGLIGSDYSSETEAISRLLSSLPSQYRLLQFGFSSTSASLGNREIYRNFYRTIPPDNIQVDTIHMFIEKLNWTYMAIVYDNDTYGIGGIADLLQKTRGQDVCFPVTIPVDPFVYNASRVEVDIETQIINADVPLEGILVFGSSVLAKLVISVTENIIQRNPNATRPVFLFSEAGAYIQGYKTNISKGAFILSPPRLNISSFQEAWFGIFQSSGALSTAIQSNPWLRDAVETTFNCSVSSNNCAPISRSRMDEVMPPSVYNQYAIQATLVLTKLVKIISQENCLAGNCTAFRDTKATPREYFIKKMNGLVVHPDKDFGSFRIPEFQDPDLVLTFSGASPEVTIPDNFPRYEVYNHQICSLSTGAACLVEAARYTMSQGLVVNTHSIMDYDANGRPLYWPNIRKPQCPDGFVCSICLSQRVETSVLFIPGEVYVVGIVPVHNKGGNPLQCGSLKQGSVDIVEVIRFAANEAQNKLNAKIGIIIIDSCNDPQIIQEKILTLNRLGVYVDDKYVAVKNKIIGYIGGWSSDVSRAVAEVTSRLYYPQISYASTAPVLSNRVLYPYFLRVPSSDRKQAQSIIDIVGYLGANVIQIVYSDTAYGVGGRDLLLELAAKQTKKICVAQTVPVTTSSDGRVVLSKIREYPTVKVVVMFLGSFEIENIIDTLNTVQRNEFLFISSEGWGTRLDITHYINLAGSITLTSQLTINAIFEKHMLSLRQDAVDPNPWIRPYLEKQFGCYNEWNYNKSSNHPCSGIETLSGTGFRIEAWSPFAERAVYTLVEGARVTLIKKCNGNTHELCQNFWKDPHDFLEAIKDVHVKENGFDTLVYDDNGDGLAGYKIYQILLDNGEAYYKQVEQNGPGPFNLVVASTINSTCSSKIDQCAICFPTASPQTSVDNSFPGAAIAVIIILGVVCCILAGILLFIFYRYGCCIKMENGKPRLYLTPVYSSKDRDAHGIDGSACPSNMEHYDSIPPDAERWKNSSEGRFTISGSANGSADRAGFNNMTLENDVERGSQLTRANSQQASIGQSSSMGTMSRENSYPGVQNPEPHTFHKAKPAPVAPPPRTGVVYQVDGSYITTVADTPPPSEGNLSGGSVASNQSGGVMSQRLSDQSLGYLRSVQTLDNRV